MSETKMLPVTLTEIELHERSQELAAKVEKLTACEAVKKDTAATQKAEIDGLKEQVVKLSRVVTTRKEPRPVEVIERRDVPKRTVLEIRVDTGEVVTTRPMTVSELQEEQQARIKFEKAELAGSGTKEL